MHFAFLFIFLRGLGGPGWGGYFFWVDHHLPRSLAGLPRALLCMHAFF